MAKMNLRVETAMKTLFKSIFAAVTLATLPAGAQTLVQGWFEVFENADNADLTGVAFNYSIEVVGTSGSDALYVFTVFNDSVPGTGSVTTTRPTATKVMFDYNPNPSSPEYLMFIASSVEGSPGTAFTTASSGTLPGGNNLLPSFTTDFAIYAEPPPSKNGVDPGEFVSVEFTSSLTIAQLAAALDNDKIRVGLHVQEAGDRGEFSVAMVSQIPEPSTSGLALAAVGLLALRRRRA
jgi:hypothetical protein